MPGLEYKAEELNKTWGLGAVFFISFTLDVSGHVSARRSLLQLADSIATKGAPSSRCERIHSKTNNFSRIRLLLSHPPSTLSSSPPRPILDFSYLRSHSPFSNPHAATYPIRRYLFLLIFLFSLYLFLFDSIGAIPLSSLHCPQI
jgi:hypothetical protein